MKEGRASCDDGRELDARRGDARIESGRVIRRSLFLIPSAMTPTKKLTPMRATASVAVVLGQRRREQQDLQHRCRRVLATGVVVTLVTSLLRLNWRKFVTLMATSETSSVW
jgi:hypothetical protein